MLRVDAGVENRDRRSRSVVPAGPCLIGLDLRNALREDRVDDLVIEYAHHIRRGPERGERGRADLDGDVGNGLIATDHAMVGGTQPADDAGAGRDDLTALRRDRRLIRQPFGDMRSRQPELHDDAGAAAGRRRRRLCGQRIADRAARTGAQRRTVATGRRAMGTSQWAPSRSLGDNSVIARIAARVKRFQDND